MNPDTLARGLGWFSIGLGATELMAADALAKSLGMEGREKLIQCFGAREMAEGVACLTQKPPTTGVWSRVAGDALDIAVLLAHMRPDNPKRHNVGIALGAVLGVTLLDVVAAYWLSEGRGGPLTRLSRRSIERLEHQKEAEMRAAEQKGEQFASKTTIPANQ